MRWDDRRATSGSRSFDTDPVPGDPARISEEAAHLASESALISQQVATLRQIAANGTEVGRHADVIRSKASDLAGQLDILAMRYRKVSTILNGWIPDLEKAQAMSIDAFALLTFGAGRVLGSMMEGTFAATEDVAKGLVQAERDASILGKAGNLLGKASDLVENSSLVKASVSFLDRIGLSGLSEGVTGAAGKFSESLDKLGGIALEKASPSLDTTLATLDKDIKPLETALYGGEKDSLMLTRKMALIADRFPESPEIAQLGAKFNTLLNIQRGVFSATNAADQWDKWANGFEWYGNDAETPVIALHIPGTQFYRDFKESWKLEAGKF